MTTKEAAALLGIQERMVRRHCHDGYLAAERHGRDYWITEESIEAFKQTRRKPGNPGTPRGPRKRKAEDHERV